MALLIAASLMSGMCENVFSDSSTDAAAQTRTQIAAQNAALAREAAAEGEVLLENPNNTLPLKHGATVALFGIGQINFYFGGTGSGAVSPAYSVSLLAGMQNKQKAGEVSVDADLASAYTAFAKTKKAGEMPLTAAQVSNAASKDSTAVLTISRTSGEGTDRTATKGDYYLSDDETAMINSVTNAFGNKNVTVVLNIGAVMDTSWIKNYPGISVLVAWQPGMEGGNATADILCGDINPSGKLADTFAASYDNYPSASEYNSQNDYELYTEDIYEGYRYFETFDPQYKQVNYPFGYGLSYTTFKTDNVSARQDGKNIVVSATVTNTGSVAGKEVEQVYYGAPNAPLDNPAKVLGAYQKTDLLQPGASQTITMSYPISDMASYDDMGKIQQSAYVLEAGDYKIYLGDSIKDAGANGVRYTYHQDKSEVTEQLQQELKPFNLAKRMINDNGTPGYESLNASSSGVLTIAASGQSLIKFGDCTNYGATESTAPSPDIEYYTDTKGQGQKCMGFMNYMGNYATFTINVEQAGTYNMSLDAANGRGVTSTNMLGFYVNGQLQPGINVELPNTALANNQWYNFITVGPYSITLPAGQVTLKVVSTSTDCGNLGSLTFERTGDSPAAAAVKTDAAVKTLKASNDSTTVTATAPTAANTISLYDVSKDPSKMDSFVAQLSNDQLAALAGGTLSKAAASGSIGNLPGFGIPAVQTSDGPAGLRLSVPTTAFPVETLLACTWNPDLLEQIGQAVGKEAKLNQIDIWLAPGMDIHRNPLCGRNFEYFSEDPLITGDMAAAEVQGVQSEGVGATLKHFACNERENNRQFLDARVSERALREVYLRGFQIAVEKAQPWAIMSAYSVINGVECAESHDLLTDILRHDWGYTGMVMTDWGNNTNNAIEIKAGNNVKMDKGDAAGISTALSNGTLTRADLVANAECLLTMIMKTNVFQRIQQVGDSATTYIKAVDFNFASANVVAQGTGDSDGGLNPAFTNKGEWMSYRINVAKDGSYAFTPRTAGTMANAKFDIYVDGNNLATYTVAKASGDWQKWVTGAPISIPLTQGNHELKIAFDNVALNLNWFELAPVGAVKDIQSAAKPTGISVANGTQLGAITTLPQTIAVTLSDGTQATLPVIWTDPNSAYKPDTAGTYSLTGTLTLPADGSVTNSQNLTVSVDVTVQAASSSSSSSSSAPSSASASQPSGSSAAPSSSSSQAPASGSSQAPSPSQTPVSSSSAAQLASSVPAVLSSQDTASSQTTAGGNGNISVGNENAGASASGSPKSSRNPYTGDSGLPIAAAVMLAAVSCGPIVVALKKRSSR